MDDNGRQALRAQVEEEIRQNADLPFEKVIAKMSPFEIKNLLLEYANEDDKKDARTLLDAGRGNPNWICTLPREAFFLLGQFALEESRRTMKLPAFDLAGMPRREGSAERFAQFLERQPGDSKPAAFLRDCYDHVTARGVDGDSLVQEWTEGIIGCEYPSPERILEHTQDIVRDYLVKAICDGHDPATPFDLFATEGGTAAMCYLFYSLKCNFLLNPGDRMALMTPIFTPYLEIPHLNDYDLDVVNVNASTLTKDGLHSWQYPDEELEKLADPSIKLLCVVNPSNPPSYAMDQASVAKLAQVVKEKNPDLMIITDDVYGTFVPHYRSLFSLLPYNTASVYSFSKYFGATGWRLADIAISQRNVFDDLIARLDDDRKATLASRYSSLTDKIASEKFIDRMVADSRLVALNGTAGLGTPQQVQMALFALYCLLDTEDIYRNRMHQLVNNRLATLWKSMGLPLAPDPLRAGYYSVIDLDLWARKQCGDEFAEWLKKNYESSDIVLRMAKDTGIVLMDGAGFDAPDWSVRVSLANLDITDYETIGEHLIQMFKDYEAVWKEETAQETKQGK
ncbi:MAG: bifunctional aspartate transaminase/aspartate 4-decarboxylase [Bifidobacterium sp.]|nr:bifunctional aspartate transaminase/aspartate 4-decarboxylase [Bifidobacterium sp.]